jgi:hypothetical protein
MEANENSVRADEAYYYNTAVVYTHGSITNAVCVVVFLQILTKRNRITNTSGNMFNFFFAKATFDALCNLIGVVYPFAFNSTFYHTNKETFNTLGGQIFHAAFGLYGNFTLLDLSGWMEVFAIIDYYLTIKRKLVFLSTKKAFYIIVSDTCVFWIQFVLPVYGKDYWI